MALDVRRGRPDRRVLAVRMRPRPPRRSTVTTVDTRRSPVEDGDADLGVLLPLSGAGTDIGEAIARRRRARRQQDQRRRRRNGRPISLFIEDEGDEAATAVGSLDKLMARTSTRSSARRRRSSPRRSCRSSIAGDVLTCSPTASALSLDDFPDKGLFFRTIPSDSLQADRHRPGDRADRASRPRPSRYIDDAFGQPFAELVSNELDRRGIGELTDRAVRSGRQRLRRRGRPPCSTRAPTWWWSSATAAPGRAWSALIDGTDDDADSRSSSTTRCACRPPPARTPGWPTKTAALLSGVSPQSRHHQRGVPRADIGAYPDSRGLYATNAYDCVNLIALAANASNSTQPPTIAAQIPAVSDGGSPCMTFTACDMDLRSRAQHQLRRARRAC